MKEARRREYKRRRYHEVYKHSTEYMARKLAYDRKYYYAKQQENIARARKSGRLGRLKRRVSKALLQFY